MAFIVADRVKETTTTTGTGFITTSGTAVSGFRTFASVSTTGDYFDYCIIDGTSWEIGRGRNNSSNQITRDYLIASSTGSFLNLGSGSKEIFLTISGKAQGDSCWALNDAIVAAGTNQATATLLVDTVNSIVSCTAGQGVLLPSAVNGSFITVSNHTTNTLLVYPASGEDVEALAVDTPMSLLPGQCYRAGCAISGHWVGIDLNPWHDESQVFAIPVAIVNPPPPPVDSMYLYARKISGRVLPKWMPPSGLDSPVQPALFGNNIIMYAPSSGTTVTGGFGTTWAKGAAAGTVSHPTPATTAPAIFNQMKRTRHANAASTTNQEMGIVSLASGLPQFWGGNAAGLGGYFFFCRFAIGLWAANTCRLFVGMTAATSAIVTTDTVPANSIGLSHISTDGANILNFVSKNATTLSTYSISGATIAAGQVFDLYMYCKPNDANLYFRVDSVNAGTTLVDGVINTTLGYTLPVNTTFLGPAALMSNGAASVAVNTVAIDVNRIYVESDH